MLEKELGIPLPGDVVLLRSEQGERDPEYQFRMWLFWSKSGIALSPTKVDKPGTFLSNRNVEGMVEWFQSLKPSKPLKDPTAACSLSWEFGAYEYDADLLNTACGDYLYVQRFAAR